MVAVEYALLPSSLGGVEGTGAELAAVSNGGSWDGGGGGNVSPAGPGHAVDAWQAQQAQRLAALRGMYARAAAPEPVPLRRPAACLLLSSAVLQGEAPAARRAALTGAGLSAFRAALSVHLNGLAAAPADASPAHVARTAAAQQQLLAAAAARPLLCTAQLLAAFGQGWVDELAGHRMRAGQQGLEAAALQGSSAVQQDGEESQFVYFAPGRLLSSSDEG